VREWITLSKTYGYSVVRQDLGGFYLGKMGDGSCPFLWRSPFGAACGIQHAKPMACRIWPFKILTSPKYGNPTAARYSYRNEEFYVYAVPNCAGITWGRPTAAFTSTVIPEFIDIRLGYRGRQAYSTSRRIPRLHR
jgi:Fe-S-cluster containining protein